MPMHRRLPSLFLAAALLAAGGASAAETVKVTLDQAKVIRISAPASTIIIGNPAIADATLQDAQTLVITGRAYGTTNMIILDDSGEPITDTELAVEAPTSNILTVQRGVMRSSMTCTPICQPTVVPGDSSDFFSGIQGQNAARNGAAAATPSTTAPTE